MGEDRGSLSTLPTRLFRTKLLIHIASQTRLGSILQPLPAPTALLGSVWGFHYKLEAAPEGAAPTPPGVRRRTASAPPKAEAREAKSRRVIIEEAPFEEPPKRETQRLRLFSFHVCAPQQQRKAAGGVVPPRPPLHIARAPPPKRASPASAPEAAWPPTQQASPLGRPHLQSPAHQLQVSLFVLPLTSLRHALHNVHTAPGTQLVPRVGKGTRQRFSSAWVAALAAPRPPPQTTPGTPPSERVQINVVLDWHKCLDRGWDYNRGAFTDRTALAINSLCAALRPCTLNILSFALENAPLYLRRDLIPAQRQLEALPARPAFVHVAQVRERVGPNGKGRQLHFVQAHFFVGDKPQILTECRRTGCVCIRAYPNAGEQGLIDNLLEIQQWVDQIGRSNLRSARRLADSELVL